MKLGWDDKFKKSILSASAEELVRVITLSDRWKLHQKISLVLGERGITEQCCLFDVNRLRSEDKALVCYVDIP